MHIAAAGEALAFAEAIGLDARACWEVIREGAAASFMLDDRGERMLDDAFTPPKSALEIFVKDMGLVTAAAREHAYPSPLAAVAEQLYVAGKRAGLSRLDDASIITLLRGSPHERGRETPAGTAAPCLGSERSSSSSPAVPAVGWNCSPTAARSRRCRSPARTG